tara:strand:- start:930 stop:1154 length:225 start_codon:yes stop_codon:yes gene_type:complete
MNKIFYSLLFTLTACGTAPITSPPAEAFELEVERSQWDRVYHAIEYLKRGQVEIKTQPDDSVDTAIEKYMQEYK